jgi:hypothetical protein
MLFVTNEGPQAAVRRNQSPPRDDRRVLDGFGRVVQRIPLRDAIGAAEPDRLTLIGHGVTGCCLAVHTRAVVVHDGAVRVRSSAGIVVVMVMNIPFIASFRGAAGHQ